MWATKGSTGSGPGLLEIRWPFRPQTQVKEVCMCSGEQGELQSVKLQLEETKQSVDGQRAEKQKLQKVISDTEAEQIQHKKQLEQVKKENADGLRQTMLETSP